MMTNDAGLVTNDGFLNNKPEDRGQASAKLLWMKQVAWIVV